MRTNYLFPSYFKTIGWIIFFPTSIINLICLFGIVDFENWLKVSVYSIFPGKIIYNSLFDEIGMIGLTLSLLFICFAKEKDEDEYIAAIRSQSLIWATIISYTLLIVCTLLIYDLAFLTFVFINLFLLLFLFMIKYHIVLYKFRRNNHD